MNRIVQVITIICYILFFSCVSDSSSSSLKDKFSRAGKYLKSVKQISNYSCHAAVLEMLLYQEVNFHGFYSSLAFNDFQKKMYELAGKDIYSESLGDYFVPLIRQYLDFYFYDQSQKYYVAYYQGGMLPSYYHFGRLFSQIDKNSGHGVTGIVNQTDYFGDGKGYHAIFIHGFQYDSNKVFNRELESGAYQEHIKQVYYYCPYNSGRRHEDSIDKFESYIESYSEGI